MGPHCDGHVSGSGHELGEFPCERQQGSSVCGEASSVRSSSNRTSTTSFILIWRKKSTARYERARVLKVRAVTLSWNSAVWNKPKTPAVTSVECTGARYSGTIFDMA